MELRRVFIANLKFYRKKEKLSQMELAELCRTSPSYIGEIEIGKKFPSVEMMEKFANALQIKPFMFFVNPEEEIPPLEKRNQIPETIKTQIETEIATAVKKILKRL